jgi:hypothetical protein
MVTIRNGYDSKSPPNLIKYLPQIISIFFLAAISFYGGMLVGMQLQVHPNNSGPSASEIKKQVEAEVQRRMEGLKSSTMGDEMKSVEKKKGKSTDKNARFPKTVEKFATGIGLISKNDFLANFDYGIPKVSSVHFLVSFNQDMCCH